jgi:pyruvate dehydrogenase kinase 2/3/4
MDELLALASCKPTALSLADMYRYAPNKRGSGDDTTNNNKQRQQEHFERLRNAQFLHRELPIRIAQRAVDLLTLPHGLNRTREVQSVANTYLQYLQQLQDFPTPTNADSERAFTHILEEFILDRHSIPMAISRGLRSLKDVSKAPVDIRRINEMEEALNRFFTARVGLRFLVEHHVLSGNGENSDDLYRKQLIAEGNDGGTLVDPGVLLTDKDVEYENALSSRGGEGGTSLSSSSLSSNDEEVKCGAIQRDCDPVKEVRRTVARVTQLCRESYGIAPNIEIVVGTGERGEGVSFTYVPHHLRYMLAELLKNSCRASVRR